MGVSVSETAAEIRIVTLSVTANSRNKRPTTSPIKSSGIKHRDERHSQRDDSKSDLLRALKRRLHRFHSFFKVARDVFDHDDGIVDDEAGRDCERH